MKNVFQELDGLAVEVVAEAQDQGDSPTEKLNVVEDLHSFVYQLTWLKHQRTKERLHVLIQNRFNYAKSAHSLGVTVPQLYKTVSYAQSLLQPKIRSVLEAWEAGDYAAARTRFSWLLADILPDPRLLSVVTDTVAPSLSSHVQWKDCEYEIRVLQQYALAGVRHALSKVNVERMQHVLAVFNSSDVGYQAERKMLEEIVSRRRTWQEGVHDLSRYFDMLSNIDEDEEI